MEETVLAMGSYIVYHTCESNILQDCKDIPSILSNALSILVFTLVPRILAVNFFFFALTGCTTSFVAWSFLRAVR